eukprot:361405-Chlamydomonas_euryale.AAC.3
MLAQLARENPGPVSSSPHRNPPPPPRDPPFGRMRTQLAREKLCELELPYQQLSVPRGSPRRQEMQDMYGHFQVSALVRAGPCPGEGEFDLLIFAGCAHFRPGPVAAFCLLLF